MPARTFAKMYKACYDLAHVITLIGKASDQMTQNDPDQRSGASGTRQRREFRKGATQYRRTKKRLSQLMGKFDRFDGACEERINAVLNPPKESKAATTSRRGRPPGSKNKPTNGRKSKKQTE